MTHRFNYNNDRMIIGHWYPASGGEFILRCLSVSKHMIMISNLDLIKSQLDDPADYSIKIKAFEGEVSPDCSDKWHRHFLQSNFWLSVIESNTDVGVHGNFTEQIFARSDLASLEYYDRFWRPIACEISHRGLGFGLKTHRTIEVQGILNILPRAKVVTVESAVDWINRNILNKLDDVTLRVYDLNERIPNDMEANRFRLDDMLVNESSFISQMETAYRWAALDDFKECREHLRKIRKIYLGWHIKG